MSEVERTGLHLLPSTQIEVPRIAESKIQFECKLHSITPFGASHLVVGEVLAMHALKGLVADCKIDTLRYGALGRVAGRNYCKVNDIIDDAKSTRLSQKDLFKQYAACRLSSNAGNLPPQIAMNV